MAVQREFAPAAVILAAGRSSRMGCPKILLPWHATTVIGHLISVWQSLGAKQIAVVKAADDLGMRAELDRLGFPQTNRILNPDAARGMFSSVQCAAEWKEWDKSITHWAIVLGDQPHLRRETLAAVMEFARRNPENICQPGRAGHGKHPIFLPACIFRTLVYSKHGTLKEFLLSMEDQIKSLEMEDDGLDLDIDLPGDYERARGISEAASSR